MLNIITRLITLEIVLRLRNSQEYIYPLGFFFIVVLLFPFAFTPDSLFLKTIFPGSVWVASLLSILLSSESIFLSDLEDGHLEQFLLGRLSLPFIIAIKLFTQWCVSALPIILFVPCLGIIFGMNAYSIFLLCISLFITTPVLVGLNCLGVVLTLGLRQQGVMLALILMPFTIPILIFGVSVIDKSQKGFSVVGPFTFLLGIALLAIAFLPFIIAATLTISLEE